METLSVPDAPASATGGRPIERFIPRPDVRELHETLVHAPADLVFEAAQELDLLSLPPVRAIIWLRERLLRAAPAPAGRPRGLVAETRSLGWGVLAQRPGRELVMGAVTRPWEANVRFTPVTPERFTAFAEPDLVKIAWTLEAEPVAAGLTRFRTETRVLATDEAARTKFRRYWSRFGIGIVLIRHVALRAVRREAEGRFRAGATRNGHRREGGVRRVLESAWGALQIAVQLMLGPFLHRWRTRWGATREEVGCRLPGDELIPEPGWSYNHAVSIRAPRSAVWPWLVQVGQGRGGFYSYEGPENLAGCDIHNVLELRPELQGLAVGDVVRMHRSGFGPPVAYLDPERALVLGGPPDASGSGATWAFYLFDGPDGTTRLLERGRHVPGRGLAARIGFGPYVIDPIGFVMSRKMLRTIKRLVEERGHARA